ncbi:MAG: NYN domain-containing protein [Chloroflexia bacterium]|nr:NYN domain-containing protein [Chloroflexia bacterium]
MKRKRVFLAVDHTSLYHTTELDGNGKGPQALLTIASQWGTLVETAIYMTLVQDSKESKRLLIDFKRMGFTRVVPRMPQVKPEGEPKLDVDLSLVIDVWQAVLDKQIDVLLLATRDSDLLPLVERLTNQGVEVYLIGPEEATGWELMVHATRFWEIEQLPQLAKVEADVAHHFVLN